MEPQQPTPPQNPEPEIIPYVEEHVVHVTRSADPIAPQIPEAIVQRHQESKQKFPKLNLTPGEYVIQSVPRHPIGILKIWALVVVLITAVFSLALLFTSGTLGSEAELSSGAKAILYFAVLLLAGLFAIGGFIATYVFENNRFILTNESVIQEIQITLFAKREQTVSLANVEDASYHQDGIIQMLLNYGSVRLSTQGDETTYSFTYAKNPKKYIADLNNAVESFKMGRPILIDDDD